jgi:hypothetical protein
MSYNIPAIAREYCKARGLAYNPVTQELVDHAQSARIADFYVAAESRPNDPQVRKAYEALNYETLLQFRALEAHGYQFLQTDKAETYPDLSTMINDVINMRQLYVWNGGTPEHGLISQCQNMQFRAVHDIFGHVLTLAPFGHFGEEIAYRSHYRMFSPLAQRALATETRGQNCALHFRSVNGVPWDRSALGAVFEPQKAFILPEYFRLP